MNDSEIVALGELSEALLASEKFTTIVAHYEMTIAADILATKPEDTKKREELYHSLWGTRGLLSFMKLNANAAYTINNPTPVTTDEDGFDLRDDNSEEETDY